MKFMSKAEYLCAAGLVVFFFLPWVKVAGLISISGYQVPDVLRGAGRLAGMMGAKPSLSRYAFYLLYLVPLLGGLAILRGIRGQSHRLPALIAGALPLACFTYALLTVGTAVLRGMAMGAWLTLLCSIAMVLVSAGIVRIPGGEQPSAA